MRYTRKAKLFCLLVTVAAAVLYFILGWLFATKL
jgi:hypothetical protein